MSYWLMKSEPDTFSIDDLARMPKQIAIWDGVRNYQARNMLRNEMQKGDLAFFYHSSCAEPAIVGIIEIAREGYPDPSAFNPESPYYDPKTSPEKPRWYAVDVKLIKKLKHPITLKELRQNPKLKNLILLRKGNRLSVMRINEKEWQIILIDMDCRGAPVGRPKDLAESRRTRPTKK